MGNWVIILTDMSRSLSTFPITKGVSCDNLYEYRKDIVEYVVAEVMFSDNAL